MKLKHFAVVIIGFVIFISDGVILPVLTGRPFGFGIMILLSAMAITFGVERWVIYLGIILAGLTELMVGAYFGTIIGAWLAMIWLWNFLNKFLNIKLLSENNSLAIFGLVTLFGFGLFGFGESVSWMISRFVYESGFSVETLINIFRSPTLLGIVIIELVMTLFVFHFIYSSQND